MLPFIRAGQLARELLTATLKRAANRRAVGPAEVIPLVPPRSDPKSLWGTGVVAPHPLFLQTRENCSRCFAHLPQELERQLNEPRISRAGDPSECGRDQRANRRVQVRLVER